MRSINEEIDRGLDGEAFYASATGTPSEMDLPTPNAFTRLKTFIGLQVILSAGDFLDRIQGIKRQPPEKPL